MIEVDSTSPILSRQISKEQFPFRPTYTDKTPLVFLNPFSKAGLMLTLLNEILRGTLDMAAQEDAKHL